MKKIKANMTNAKKSIQPNKHNRHVPSFKPFNRNRRVSPIYIIQFIIKHHGSSSKNRKYSELLVNLLNYADIPIEIFL